MKNRLDLVSTYGTELFNLASMLFVHKLAAMFWGPQGFSEYSLSRRVIALTLPIVVVGLDLGMSRFVAETERDHEAGAIHSYFLAGLLIVVTGAVLWGSTLAGLSPFFATMFFGSATYAYLLPSISLVILGMAFHQVCCSFLRGSFLTLAANLLQLVNIGVLPIVAFLFGEDVATSFLALGVMINLVAVSVTVLLVKQCLAWRPPISHIYRCMRELVIYGLQRTMGAFAMVALFALPALIVAHTDGLEPAGAVAFATSLITMVGAVFAPVGLVLLPRASRMMRQNALGHLQHTALRILAWSVAGALLFVILLELFIAPIITSFLGQEFTHTIHIVQIVLLGAVPYAVYMSMRSIIDAFRIGLNVRNMLVALAVFVLVAGLAWRLEQEYIYTLAGFVLALWTLGLLTLRNLNQIWRMTQAATAAVAG